MCQLYFDRFNSIQTEMVHVPAGRYLHDGRIFYDYPEYTGSKEWLNSFYYQIAEIHSWGATVYNAILVSVIGEAQAYVLPPQEKE